MSRGRGGSRRSPGRMLLGLVLLGVLAFAIERLVVTDREALEDLLDRAGRAIQAGDFEALRETLDEGYQAEDRDRDEAVAYARSLWNRYRPLGLTVTTKELIVEEGEARAQTTVQAYVLARPFRIPVHVVFRKGAKGWRILGAAPFAWPR